MTRPSTFDRDIADKLIEWVSSGRALSRFCAQDGMPSMLEVSRWRKRHAEFEAEYQEALEAGHDTLAEETLDIADSDPHFTNNGVVDTGSVAWKKLRIETRMRLLSKVSRRYGDKVQLSGGDTPITISDAERAAKIDALMAVALERYDKGRGQSLPTATEAADLNSRHLHDHVRGDWEVDD